MRYTKLPIPSLCPNRVAPLIWKTSYTRLKPIVQYESAAANLFQRINIRSNWKELHWWGTVLLFSAASPTPCFCETSMNGSQKPNKVQNTPCDALSVMKRQISAPLPIESMARPPPSAKKKPANLKTPTNSVFSWSPTHQPKNSQTRRWRH